MRQVDFIHHRHDSQFLLHCGVGVGHGLCLDALEGVHQQHGSFTTGKRAGNFVLKVDVPWRVDQIQLVLLPIHFGLHRHGTRFDRYPTLPLKLHVVENLLLHLSLADRVGDFEQPVGERALPMVDMGHDREVTDVLGVHQGNAKGGRW